MRSRASTGLSVTLSGVLLVAAGTFPAGSAEVAIRFDPGYATWNSIGGAIPDFGDSLIVVGFVQGFDGPLADLNARPRPQFTYVLSGLDCTEQGMWDDFIHDMGGWYAEFTDGYLRVYADDDTDGQCDDRRTFSDGTMIFEAVCTNVILGVPLPMADLRFTGGTLFDRVSRDGIGYAGTLEGLLRLYVIPEELWELGYRGVMESTVMVSFPVPVQATTWGRLKTLYGH